MNLAARLEEDRRPPRILVTDIETSPAVAYVWGLRDQQVSTSQIVEPSRVLCFAAKWIGDAKPRFWSEFHDGRDAMVEAAWRLLDEADIVVGYNHVAFDIKHLQREFVQGGYAPPSPWQDVDLLKVMRARFKFLSNRLGYVTETLGLGGKEDSGGMDTWRGVLAGDKTAWATMRAYNLQDVEVTHALYAYLLPWLRLPHMGLWTGDLTGCASCGGTNLTPDGVERTKTTAYLRLRCKCGALHKQLPNGQTRPL